EDASARQARSGGTPEFDALHALADEASKVRAKGNLRAGLIWTQGDITDAGWLVRWVPNKRSALLTQITPEGHVWHVACQEHQVSGPAANVKEADTMARGERRTWCPDCTAA